MPSLRLAVCWHLDSGVGPEVAGSAPDPNRSRPVGHSVSSHLGIEIRSYDRAIRQFIPGYEEMLRVAAREIVRGSPDRVLDLGAGTGALAEAVLSIDGSVTVELVDVDPEMLAQARVRLSRFPERTRHAGQSFLDPLPACDAVSASLALHHVGTVEAKISLYGRVWAALSPGGVFVNADAVVSAEPSEREATMRTWVGHMVRSGIGEAQAYEHLAQWAEEDTYFPLDVELSALESAGFEAECAWHRAPLAVVVARKRSS